MKTKLVALASCLCLFSCGRGLETTEKQTKELVFYCGAGIRPAAEALITAFEEAHPDIKIAATYAGSGRLLGQIASSRTGDLFMPGSSFYVDKAVKKNLADAATRKKVAYFIPVIFVQKGNPKGVKTLSDLAELDLRVGLGDERAVAIGRRAIKIFEKNSIPLEKAMKNVVYKSGTVNELGVAIEMKNVDAVIMWDANARQFAHAGDTIEIPPKQNIVTEIPIVALKSSSYPSEANAFVDFVISDAGKKIFTRKKYTVNLVK